MAKFPEDPFDDFPEDLARVGAHRAPKSRGGGWIGFAWAALATGVLIAGGLYGVSQVNEDVSFEIPGLAQAEPEETPTPTPTPTMDPILDPADIAQSRKITITVLNGTPIVGLQNTAGKTLDKAGWPIVSQAKASTTDIEDTIVYYSNPADEDVARGLVLAMGLGDVRESTAFLGAPVTVVLGADYQAAIATE
jgi:hypothetical protein